MKLVEFIKDVEVRGLLCVLRTEEHEGETFAGIMVMTKPNDGQGSVRLPNTAVAYTRVTGGEVDSADFARELMDDFAAKWMAA
jgi:hypothetical protein